MKLHLRQLIYPGFLIILYEMYIIRVYDQMEQYPIWVYSYFIIASAIIALLASILSDKYSRKLFLNISLIIGSIILIFLHFGYGKIIIILSPFFFSIPVSRAALIEHHEHISIKNLMCISFISLFLPWCFFSYFSSSNSDYFILSFLMVTIISAFFFKDLKEKKTHKLEKTFSFFNYKNFLKVLFFIISFLLVQMTYFLIFESFEYSENHMKMYRLIGTSLLAGSFCCLFLKGRHNDLIFMAYIFLFLLTLNSILAYFLWHTKTVLQIFLGETAVVGGIYLPLVTEKIAYLLGRSKRGLACGLMEFITSIASILALISVYLFHNKYLLLISFILILAVGACIFQKISDLKPKKEL